MAHVFYSMDGETFLALERSAHGNTANRWATHFADDGPSYLFLNHFDQERWKDTTFFLRSIKTSPIPADDGNIPWHSNACDCRNVSEVCELATKRGDLQRRHLGERTDSIGTDFDISYINADSKLQGDATLKSERLRRPNPSSVQFVRGRYRWWPQNWSRFWVISA